MVHGGMVHGGAVHGVWYMEYATLDTIHWIRYMGQWDITRGKVHGIRYMGHYVVCYMEYSTRGTAQRPAVLIGPGSARTSSDLK